MSDWLIVWRQPETFRWDVEVLETEEEARAALNRFENDFPWNTYYLAPVAEEKIATQKWMPPFTISFEGVGGGAKGSGGE